MLFFAGCNEKNNPNPGNDMDNMIVPDGFMFETTHLVPMTIQMPSSIDFSELRSRFDIYTALPEDGGTLISSGSFDNTGNFSGTLRLPITLTEITVVTLAGTITVEVPETTLKEDGVIINYGDDYGDMPPDTTEPQLKSSGISQLVNNHKLKLTAQNIIGNGDFESSDMGTVFSWNNPKPVDQRWYITQQSGPGERYNDNGNWVFRSPLSESGNSYYGGVSQMIEASAGDVITFSADIKSVGNNNRLYCRLYIIPKNSNGNPIRYFYVRDYYPSSNWHNKTITATMPSGTSTVNILVWLNDYNSNAAVYVDNVVVTGPVTDNDNDGVDDDMDDYPSDASRAFDVYYPNSVDWGTLTYEDLWPGKGDYDFNDLVLDYRFKSVLNSSNELVEFYTDYSVRAIGATLMNGFALMIPGNPANVASVTGTNITESYLSLDANGTEQGQSETVIFLFDNAFTMIGSSGASFVNTKPGAPYVEPEINQLHVLFNSPINNVVTAPYNPFIVIDGERGKEVHLPGEPPTDLADPTLFGTYGDDSNPATNKYYQTTNNLPWAIDIPVKFDYSVEQVQIINSYNHFKEWGESGGSTYIDWYENKTGYRNNSNIYFPPQ